MLSLKKGFPEEADALYAKTVDAKLNRESYVRLQKVLKTNLISLAA